MTVRWTRATRSALVEIGDYIARDSEVTASAFVEKLIAACEILITQPRAGRVVPEFGRLDIRELIRGNYRIVYRVVESEVHILTVFEGHRSLDELDPDTPEG